MAKREHISRDRWSGIIPKFLKGKARTHIKAKEKSWGRELSYREVDEVLTWLFKEHDVRARAASELHSHKQREGEHIAEFISIMQRIASKAYLEAPSIANKTIIEHLKKGLVDEFSRNYVKTQLIRNSQITVYQLEKELYQMEEH